MLPPQTAVTREWAGRVATALPELTVVVAEDEAQAAREIARAEAAFGTPSPALLRQAGRLRWLQAPQAAPPAGYYHDDLIAHPVIVTNFREIYNDHIGAHIMAFVLAFARGLHYYLPLQLRREWRPAPSDTGVVHLPEATALIVGVGGSAARPRGWRRPSACASSGSTRDGEKRRPACPSSTGRTRSTRSSRRQTS
jgi:phosphoglycerate dehydrogenase-like enzyme